MSLFRTLTLGLLVLICGCNTNETAVEVSDTKSAAPEILPDAPSDAFEVGETVELALVIVSLTTLGEDNESYDPI